MDRRLGERPGTLRPRAEPGADDAEGTNTWVLAEPGAARAVVVDPGPLDEGHLQAVLDVVAAEDRRVGLVLLTHGHLDHSEASRRFAELTGAPVRALDPAHRLGEEGLGDGDVVAMDGLELRVAATPGHSWDSMSFVLPAERGVLTGDTVLGRGTTVLAHPDGELGAYLDSLRALLRLAAAAQITRVLPGHGPVLDDALGVVEYYLAHREERLAQVEQALAAGCRSAREIVERVYADVDPILWPAAEWSVRAQLAHLSSR